MYPLLGDHSRLGITTVDPEFVGTHARLSRSIQFLDISRDFSQKAPSWPSGLAAIATANYLGLTLWKPLGAVSRVLGKVVLAVWRLAPSVVRMVAYRQMWKLGQHIYGASKYGIVQRLPFGLYLKSHEASEGLCNEFNALRVVGRHTSIPIPAALDVVFCQGHADDPAASESYLLTTRAPGLQLASCQYVLSDRDLEHIATQLKDYLTQLRDIPRLLDSQKTISNTLGEACRDTRIRGGSPIGPFVDEAAFSQKLRFSDEPARRGHKIVFTHADLNPQSILLGRAVRPDGGNGWSVTGIIDWEMAGYYPEYWEYTKAMFEGSRWSRRYNDFVRSIFVGFGDYSQEMDVERRAWELGDAV